MGKSKENKRELVYNWSFRKAVFYPTCEIYNSLSGFYDYGSLGVALKRNWENLWRSYFVNEENYWEIEGNVILPEQALIASGHVANFNDPIVSCEKCGEKFRADNLVEDKIGRSVEGLTNKEMGKLIKNNDVRCLSCDGELGEVKTFNLMFDLQVGPVNEKDSVNDLLKLSKREEINTDEIRELVKDIENTRERLNRAYLRPETAQIPYLNFKREFEANRQRLPMGLASIGKAFRNEISPRQGIFRLRELNQAELQIFFDPRQVNVLKKDKLDDWKDLMIRYKDEENEDEGEMSFKEVVDKFELPSFYAYYLGKKYNFMKNFVGFGEKIRVRKLSDREKAFYNKFHFDFEFYYESLGNWKEIAGLHYRTDHDLGAHSKHSGVDLSVATDDGKVVPHVVEVSLGLDRNLLAIIDRYLEEETVDEEKNDKRVVFKVPDHLAPHKVAVLPLLSNKEQLVDKAGEIFNKLQRVFGTQVFFDSKGSIGKRYRRQDEVGTPYCVTVDFETLGESEDKSKEGTVTVRHRDSMKQERVEISKLVDYLC